MYLSTLVVNVGSNPDRPRPGRKWIQNLYHVHQRLCMAFPSAVRKSQDPLFVKPFTPHDFAHNHVHVPRRNDAGFLFRVDIELGRNPVILVQSSIRPDWDYAFQNAEFLLTGRPQVSRFDPNYDRGEELRFRLVANPTRKIDTKSTPGGTRRNGRRVPVRSDQLVSWLTSRSERLGFKLCEDKLLVFPGYVFVKKPGSDRPLRLRSARYEGILTVTDPRTFRDCLIAGIGPAKGFGFGLMTVKRIG